jgi:hypothetical protein
MPLTSRALLMLWMVILMPEVQDIFLMYGRQYYQKYRLSPEQYKAMNAIMSCRTSNLGGHIDECDKCGYVRISYNSCRNRHCPKCQTITKEKWIDARKEELLPIPYFHVVFTIPEELNMIVYQNQKIAYKILFDAVSGTLKELSADKKHLGAQIGFSCVLHSWGSNMLYHPHLHVVLASGGLTPEGKFKTGGEDFFIHVNVLSSKFRGKFLYMLKKAYSEGKLKFHGSILEYSNEQLFRRALNPLYMKNWIVYCKETFNGPESVISYLGRYTHRVCISNNRILSIKDGYVTFKWRDYRDNKVKVMTIAADEFIRRFLMHVLPHKFMKIKHYGILANRNKKTKLKKCRIALNYTHSKAMFKGLHAVEIIKLITGKDVTLCPRCNEGKMHRVRSFDARGISPPVAV